MVIVNLTAATICFLGNCYPALIGHATPIGEFQLADRITMSPGYGGDILQYSENETTVLAIHRIWLGNPKQHRMERLLNIDPKVRIITNGCINILPEVYEKLKKCCSNDTLSIVP